MHLFLLFQLALLGGPEVLGTEGPYSIPTATGWSDIVIMLWGWMDGYWICTSLRGYNPSFRVVQMGVETAVPMFHCFQGPPPFGLTLIGLPPIGLPPIGLTPFGLGLPPIGLPPFGLTPFGLPPFGQTPFGLTPIGLGQF